MTQPTVYIEEVDGALGVLPPSAGRLHALIGCAEGGPIAQPATFGRVKDLVSTFKSGPLVEAAAHSINTYGRPALVIRAAAPADGTTTLAAQSKTGTSVITLFSGPNTEPVDDIDARVRVVKGGTVGTEGITYEESFDAGRTWGPVKGLGTLTTLKLTEAEAGVDVGFALAAGTLVKGDTFGLRTTAHSWDTTTLGAALDALALSVAQWEQLQIVGPMNDDAFDLVELKFAALYSRSKDRFWVGNTRLPNIGETPAQFLTAMSTEFGGKISKTGGVCYGAVKFPSAVTARKQRRPVAFMFGALQASVSEEINVADSENYELKGASITDANGNPEEHDESVYPGADDARFITLRTLDEKAGVYVNRPRLFSSDTSDFQLIPHRRVMNLARGILRTYFRKRLNKPVFIDPATGFLLEHERLEIQLGANNALAAGLLAKPKASGAIFTLSKTDIVLSTKTLTGDAKIIPLAYPEGFNISLGFFNPALQVFPAAA